MHQGHAHGNRQRIGRNGCQRGAPEALAKGFCQVGWVPRQAAVVQQAHQDAGGEHQGPGNRSLQTGFGWVGHEALLLLPGPAVEHEQKNPKPPNHQAHLQGRLAVTRNGRSAQQGITQNPAGDGQQTARFTLAKAVDGAHKAAPIGPCCEAKHQASEDHRQPRVVDGHGFSAVPMGKHQQAEGDQEAEPHHTTGG